MRILENVTGKKETIAAGLMSGTSTDGVDAALIKIKVTDPDITIEIIDFLTHPYPFEIRMKLNSLIESKTTGLDDITFLNFRIGEIFADALINLSKKARIPLKDIDFIGSHGQTVWHSPPEDDKSGYTLQIGDGDVIKEKTGILTVSDFRISDMAAGGEGAPFVPFVDFLLFKDSHESRGLLNIGGISNITVIPAGLDVDSVFAFDCGPGNILIDAAAQILFNTEYDTDGRLAGEGTVSLKLLDEMLDHPFILKKPPKSTGRETFDSLYCREIITKGRSLKLSDHDIITTISEFTVHSIFYNYNQYIAPVTELKRIIVSGGGILNQYLMNSLTSVFNGVIIETSEKYGIPPDAKEAVVFALLAYRTLAGRTANLPKVTGAKKKVICGKISLPGAGEGINP